MRKCHNNIVEMAFLIKMAISSICLMPYNTSITVIKTNLHNPLCFMLTSRTSYPHSLFLIYIFLNVAPLKGQQLLIQSRFPVKIIDTRNDKKRREIKWIVSSRFNLISSCHLLAQIKTQLHNKEIPSLGQQQSVCAWHAQDAANFRKWAKLKGKFGMWFSTGIRWMRMVLHDNWQIKWLSSIFLPWFVEGAQWVVSL